MMRRERAGGWTSKWHQITRWRWHTLKCLVFSPLFFFAYSFFFFAHRLVQTIPFKKQEYSIDSFSWLETRLPLIHNTTIFSLLEYNLVEEQFKYIYCIACQHHHHQQQTIVAHSEKRMRLLKKPQLKWERNQSCIERKKSCLFAWVIRWYSRKNERTDKKWENFIFDKSEWILLFRLNLMQKCG